MKNKIIFLLGPKVSNKIKQLKLTFNFKKHKILRDNRKFKDIHKGKRCFIFGSGPSIQKLNFKMFANEYTFTVNQFPRFENFEDLKTNYHLFSDERIFYLNETDINYENLKNIKKLNNQSNDLQFFSILGLKNFFENNKCCDLNKIHYFSDALEFYENYNEKIDFTKNIPWFPTIIQYCIFLAIYMGFTEIYLLGCECTGFKKVLTLENENANVSYGYKVDKKEYERIKKQLKQFSAAEELETNAKILRYYDWFNKLMDTYNVKIINCTDGGILNAFERKNINNILKQ